MIAPPTGWETLAFEERQKRWIGFTRKFMQNNGRGERPTVWEIRVQDDRIFTSHGLLGGARQETDRVGKAKNVGKANAISPAQDALAEARRLARKKSDFEGYDEYLGDFNIDRRNEDKSVQAVLTNLPSSFCLYKPDNSLSSKALIKKIDEGKALFAVKRNGFAYWAIVDYYGAVKLYSRRSRAFPDDEGPTELADGTLDYLTAVSWNARFPHIVQQMEHMGLPPGTMLAMEIYVPRPRHQDGFKLTQQIVQSMTADALVLQAQHGWVRGYVWDIPFFNGVDQVSTVTVGERYAQIEDLLMRGGVSGGALDPVQVLPFKSAEEAQAYALANGLEGFVGIDPLGVYGDKGWNLKGKPDRPAAFCAKIKPWLEDDFVVLWDPSKKWGTHGKGKHEAGKRVTLPNKMQVIHGGIGSVGLFQYNKKRELIYCCDCSSGMDFEFQAMLNPASFPQVWRVLFTDRTYISEGDDTNALTFPKLDEDGVRRDKRPEECINERL